MSLAAWVPTLPLPPSMMDKPSKPFLPAVTFFMRVFLITASESKIGDPWILLLVGLLPLRPTNLPIQHSWLAMRLWKTCHIQTVVRTQKWCKIPSNSIFLSNTRDIVDLPGVSALFLGTDGEWESTEVTFFSSVFLWAYALLSEIPFQMKTSTIKHCLLRYWISGRSDRILKGVRFPNISNIVIS